MNMVLTRDNITHIIQELKKEVSKYNMVSYIKYDAPMDKLKDSLLPIGIIQIKPMIGFDGAMQGINLIGTHEYIIKFGDIVEIKTACIKSHTAPPNDYSERNIILNLITM